MADVLGQAKGMLPPVDFSFSAFVGIMAWLILIVVAIAIAGGVTWWYILSKKFNKKIIIFEKIGSSFQHTRTDKAMEVKIGLGGDTIFYLKKHKKYLPSPSIQMGKRIYWYTIRKDNEWINFSMTDLDVAQEKAGAKFLDKEMRYARTQIQRSLKDRYDKPGFWKQYGLLVFSIAFVTIIGIFAWLSLDKFLDIMSSVQGLLDQIEPLITAQRDILSSLDNICTQSGITRV